MEQKTIGIIVGSTREGRLSRAVAEWVQKEAQAVCDHEIILLDLADYPLPFFGEPDTKEAINNWESMIDKCKGIIFVTPEYNHSIPGVLKNALDFAYTNWDRKVAGIVSYGFGANGARAAYHLRGILGAIGVIDIKTQILLSLFDDMNNKQFAPRNLHLQNIKKMISEMLYFI
jgi:NAD(P)H-dependent FMN reductase